MDWKKLIGELEASGLSQKEISDTVGCSQPYVSQLKTGKKDSPDFAIGTSLVELHEKRMAPKKAAGKSEQARAG